MAKFVLFDIDGTLIDAGGAGLAALNRALRDLSGTENGFAGLDLAGKTDLQIIQEGLQRIGLKNGDGLVASLVRRYVEHLPGEMVRRRGSLKAGVKVLLPRLRDGERQYLGLLTGNLAEGARLKLGPFGLNEFFPVGAFGDDHEDRNELLPFALRRLREREKVSVPYGQCIVVGDTPRDVACAQVHGAAAIAVATGRYTMAQLRETGADLVLPDLSDTEEIVRWIRES
jgi:phosphoglycolate phosphatase-like HAD superfamily hydrolase